MRREFSVLVDGGHIFGCGPKPRTETALEKSLAPIACEQAFASLSSQFFSPNREPVHRLWHQGHISPGREVNISGFYFALNSVSGTNIRLHAGSHEVPYFRA